MFVHGLLSPELQRLFARLAIFAGTFSFEAAETVLAGTVDELHALVEASLLKAVGQERFFADLPTPTASSRRPNRASTLIP